MDEIRKPFQGVWNIIRFNWHYYVLTFSLVAILFLFRNSISESRKLVADVLMALILLPTIISLLVSYYVYDLSSLYKFSWLKSFNTDTKETIVNIHAGFDETSSILKNKFLNAQLVVFDFYDPVKHTEVSIKRARKVYPPFPNTKRITTNNLPLKDNVADKIFITLSAHEIRDAKERVYFFTELRRAVNSKGQIIVTEHLRDTANFLAYNVGYFHFYSKQIWLNTFHKAELQVAQEIKLTPFITTFILTQNGTAH